MCQNQQVASVELKGKVRLGSSFCYVAQHWKSVKIHSVNDSNGMIHHFLETKFSFRFDLINIFKQSLHNNLLYCAANLLPLLKG